ncbi:uncharacterized protein LOC121377989 [Gigantopelta aegis]|uniref:uncharacterized protein LOC121377989 n=1 Tax=Gigantopelta aegis TaxID=1735272 RepID=UPI001B887B7B|nr:uncharacterized protein LOC121377989 [Gigantopelta aegis]
MECHTPYLIKKATDETPFPPFKKVLFEAAANENYPEHIHIYTDGSKNPDNGRVGFAVVEEKISKHAKLVKYARLSDNLSVYTAELTAIYEALIWIRSKQYPKSVIFSDSLSSIQSLQTNRSTRPDILAAIHKVLNELNQLKLTVFEWVPAHVGIIGNEVADYGAKTALSITSTITTLPLGITEQSSCQKQKNTT